MKAKRQYKETPSRVLQSNKNNYRIADNRPYFATQTNVLNRIQNTQNTACQLKSTETDAIFSILVELTVALDSHLEASEEDKKMESIPHYFQTTLDDLYARFVDPATPRADYLEALNIIDAFLKHIQDNINDTLADMFINYYLENLAIKSKELSFRGNLEFSQLMYSRRRDSFSSEFEVITSDELQPTTDGFSLSLGEADFSFAKSRSILNDPTHHIDTEYMSKPSLEIAFHQFQLNIRALEDAGAIIKFKVDATKPLATDSIKAYDNIVFMFPYVKSTSRGQTSLTKTMLLTFLDSAHTYLNPGGFVCITISNYEFYQSRFFGNIGLLASKYHIEKRPFEVAEFPTYSHRQTGKDTSAGSTEENKSMSYIFHKR